ncbi:MAG: hypothetical protein R8M45_03865 [Ghiorsea sp.]
MNFGTGGINLLDVTLTSDGGKSVDLRDVYYSISIFEDIFSHGMSGHIILKESYNLPEVFPIICEETLTIGFNTQIKPKKETSFTKSFRITSVENFSLSENGHECTYLLNFTTQESIANMGIKISRSYGDKPATSSDIVREVCTGILNIDPKLLQVEKSRFERDIVVPNLSPFELFRYLGNTDILDSSSENFDKESTFLFFEDKVGFKFVALTTLLEGKLHKTQYVTDLESKQVSMTQRDQGASKKVISENQVLSYIQTKSNRNMMNMSKGLFANKFICHDIIHKTIIESSYDYNTEFTGMSHVEPQKSAYMLKNKATHTPDENISILPYEGYYKKFVEDTPWRQKMISRLTELNNHVIEATVNGNSSTQLGSIVNWDIPSLTEEASGDKKNNKLLSGKWLVSKIRHVINADDEGYQQILELRKGCWRK